jgi:hypothetical protein
VNQGAQEGLFDEKKTEGRKSRDTVSLTKMKIPFISESHNLLHIFVFVCIMQILFPSHG